MKRYAPSAFIALFVFACGGTSPNNDDGGINEDVGGEINGTDGGIVENPSEGGTSVSTQNIVVKANGQDIGYAMGFTDFLIWIWDDAHDITFVINDTTGYVSTYTNQFFTTSDCTGTSYGVLVSAACGAQEGLQSNRHSITPLGVGSDYSGFTRPSGLLIESGGLVSYVYKSNNVSGNSCLSSSNTNSYCGFAWSPTTIIPVAFPLPITVEAE